jgi:selenocysteine-specific elongation factor
VKADTWFDTTVFDARLTVLAGLRSPLTHRGSFTVHVGSHFQSAAVRIIDGDSIGAGSTGRVRVRFRVPLPLRPTDRFLLRDTSTNITVGGGEILDVDPVTRLSRADPDGSVQSIMAGRGFVPVHTAELLTGQKLEPVVGTWYATPDALESARADLTARLGATTTISLAALKNHERDLIDTLPDVVTDGDVARLRAVDSLRTHPLLAEIRSWGLTGPSSATVDRNIVRQLVQRGLVFEHDAIAFHVDTLNDLRGQLAELWHRHPDGFLVSHLREALGITRKHAVPLAECLDRLGLTRRVGDGRVPGHSW